MLYFVTGATGFIGRRLVKALLARRGAVVYFLVRPGSAGKVAALRTYWGVSARRAIAVSGDLASRRLGVADEVIASLKGRVDHLFHLAALYDLRADAQDQQRVNVTGTRHLLAFARAVGAGHLHHVSSIAAAGLYDGVFHEDMFDEAEGLDHPYFRTKHEGERLVRAERRVPWTVYRPGIVVGDSRTGEMDKVDGPYHVFKLVQRLRQALPPWFPVVGIEGGRLNLVPVDYVVAALDHIAHRVGPASGGCYHLVDPAGCRVGDLLDIVARAAHAPRIGLYVNAGLFGAVPRGVRRGLAAAGPLRRARELLTRDLGLPKGLLDFVNYPTRFDSRRAEEALRGSGIECPRFEDYAWRLWDYWERHLDPDLHVDRSLGGAVAGRVVLVTGGSSGIGLAAACRFAESGATTIVCARDEARLAAALHEIRERAVAKGVAEPAVFAYAADIADAEDCADLVHTLLERHGGVDVLVNNAGRSIRRAIENSVGRFHDFERTMQLNYFGALRLTMGLLPAMVARRRGHVVNISSIGVLTSAPRFSAYVASKAALDAWTRCAASEFADRGVDFTTINMPLVRTPMIAPTRIYNNVPALSAEQAAEMIVRACIERPVRVATRLGVFGQVLNATAPRLAQFVMNTAFRMFPDSEAARGRHPDGDESLSAEAAAMQQMMRGIHF